MTVWKNCSLALWSIEVTEHVAFTILILLLVKVKQRRCSTLVLVVSSLVSRSFGVRTASECKLLSLDLHVASELRCFDLLVVALRMRLLLHFRGESALGSSVLVHPPDLEGLEYVVAYCSQVLSNGTHLSVDEGVAQDLLFVVLVGWTPWHFRH